MSQSLGPGFLRRTSFKGHQERKEGISQTAPLFTDALGSSGGHQQVVHPRSTHMATPRLRMGCQDPAPLKS